MQYNEKHWYKCRFHVLNFIIFVTILKIASNNFDGVASKVHFLEFLKQDTMVYGGECFRVIYKYCWSHLTTLYYLLKHSFFKRVLCILQCSVCVLYKIIDNSFQLVDCLPISHNCFRYFVYWQGSQLSW